MRVGGRTWPEPPRELAAALRENKHGALDAVLRWTAANAPYRVDDDDRQELLLALLRSGTRRATRSISDLRAYLGASLRRISARAAAADRDRRAAESAAARSKPRGRTADDPSRASEVRERLKAASRAIDRLPTRERLAVTAVVRQGLSCRAAARAVSAATGAATSVRTVWRLLASARRRLVATLDGS